MNCIACYYRGTRKRSHRSVVCNLNDLPVRDEQACSATDDQLGEEIGVVLDGMWAAWSNVGPTEDDKRQAVCHLGSQLAVVRSLLAELQSRLPEVKEATA